MKKFGKFIRQKIKFKEKKYDGSFASLIHCTGIPIFKKEKLRYELHGSGFIIHQKEKSKLVTARHVFEGKGTEFYVSHKEEFIPIEGDAHFPYFSYDVEGKISGQFKPDFCIITLTKLFMKKNADNIIGFDESFIYQHRSFGAGIFIIAGFLTSKTEFIVNSKFLYVRAFSHELTPILTETGKIMFALPWKTEEGDLQPELNGLSGAPIFYIPTHENRLYIIGIGKEYEVNRSKGIIDISIEPFIIDYLHCDGV
ncbi:hypothetical protein LFX25_19845 [Leptospira sp. FAT2]|uniref:hypothetical protein n=1 Tax=Leptospira sanjuanensis TaxID=2879643 RepID=UPI001EE8B966|nr:hypothetical protein [Leptospira sanjuanensis]MCG6195498.1 hypothetical protein [Leptospira sanjuanensis]